nr:hypothetical protein [Archangium sp.]
MDSSRPKACFTRAWTCVSSSEWPPRSKKLSVAPTRSSRRTSRQMRARMRSASLEGGRERVLRSRRNGRASSAARSTFPLDVSGRRSHGTKTEGTMYSGSERLRKVRSPASSSVRPSSATT